MESIQHISLLLKVNAENRDYVWYKFVTLGLSSRIIAVNLNLFICILIQKVWGSLDKSSTLMRLLVIATWKMCIIKHEKQNDFFPVKWDQPFFLDVRLRIDYSYQFILYSISRPSFKMRIKLKIRMDWELFTEFEKRAVEISGLLRGMVSRVYDTFKLYYIFCFNMRPKRFYLHIKKS